MLTPGQELCRADQGVAQNPDSDCEDDYYYSEDDEDAFDEEVFDAYELFTHFLCALWSATIKIQLSR